MFGGIAVGWAAWVAGRWLGHVIVSQAAREIDRMLNSRAAGLFV